MTRINVVEAIDKGVNITVHVHHLAPNHQPALETVAVDNGR